MKAKGIRIAMIAIAGVGLFAIQSTKPESVQAANAQAFDETSPSSEFVTCYKKLEYSWTNSVYECFSCVKYKATGSNAEKCIRTTQDTNGPEPDPGIAP